MACVENMFQDILNTCENQPTAGLEPKSWMINRDDIDTITYDPSNDVIVTGITLKATKQAYVVQGFKKTSNSGSDIVVSDTAPDQYTNFFSLFVWEKDGATIQNINGMNNVVVITEKKGSKTEGTFEILGLSNGLYKSTATSRANDNNGSISIELTNQEGEGEKTFKNIFWNTDYATSKADIEALETP